MLAYWHKILQKLTKKHYAGLICNDNAHSADKMDLKGIQVCALKLLVYEPSSS